MSQEPAPTKADSAPSGRGRWLPVPFGRLVVHLTITALVPAVAYYAVTILSYVAFAGTGNMQAYATFSTLVGLVIVTYLMRWRTVAGLRKGIPALPWLAVGGYLAYVATPMSWTGSALFWWLLVDSPPLAFWLDMPVWMAAVVLGILWGASQQSLVHDPATPYG